jgi:hypothetical protein
MRRPGHPPGGLSQCATFRGGQVDDALRQVASVFASGYLRLLAHQAAILAPSSAPHEISKPLDSCGQKSVNVQENNGDGDA